jgi:Tol biopolymer transport system component
MAEKERKRLDSWGEIAKYLNRDVTTVKRWEKEKLLPVHRLPGGKRQAVFAYQDEIDKWLSGEHKVVSEDKDDKYFDKAGVITTVMVIVAVTVVVSHMFSSFSPRVLRQQRLTHDQLDKGLQLFTDGPHVYFEEVASPKASIALVGTAGGEVVHIPLPFQDFALLGFASDGSAFFAAVNPNSPNRSFWMVPLPGGSPRPIQQLSGLDATWSAKGQRAAYVEDIGRHTLYTSNADGTEAERIFTIANARIECPRWAPDGRALRFAIVGESEASSLWEVNSDGSNPHVVFAKGSSRHGLCGSWTPDGKYYVFDSFQDGQFDLWVLREEQSWLHHLDRTSIRLTNGPIEFLKPIVSVDGKRIFAIGIEHDAELVRYDANSQTFVPFIGGISAGRVDFSRDGEWVAYVKHPEQTLWCRSLESGKELQLTFAPLEADAPHWSPDGQQIAFRASTHGQPKKIFVIARGGGVPQEVLPKDKEEEGIPTWSPDGNSLVFGELRWHPDKITIHILNLKSGQVSTVPGSQGLWTPRWSPDGQYLLALTADALSSNSKSLLIFDFSSSQWRKLVEHLINEPVWSHDGKFIYFDVAQSPPGKDSAIFRVDVNNGRLERIVSLENFHRAGQVLGDWLGLAPDDSPLLLRDRRNTEIYALDVEW